MSKIRGQITRADKVLHDVCRYVKTVLPIKLKHHEAVYLPYTDEMETLCDVLMSESSNNQVREYAKFAKTIFNGANVLCGNTPNAEVRRVHIYQASTGDVYYINQY